MGRIEADIALESWLFGFCLVWERGSLPYLPTLVGIPANWNQFNSTPKKTGADSDSDFSRA